jgi:Ca-activated chloride channel homolog
MWKARAQYLAGDYTGTLTTLTRVQTAEARFYIGNALAHLDDYAGAVKAYDDALALQPGWPAALTNRQLMQKLLAQPKPQPEQGSDEEGDSPDEHKPKQKGQPTQSVLVLAPSEDVWMRNLNMSPATFLRQRFEQESGAR